MPADALPGPRGPKPLTFKMQEGYFVERVERAQARIELEAVDDRHRIGQPDVLRSKIAMGIDDAPGPDAGRERLGALGEKAALYTQYPADLEKRQMEARIAEHALVGICRSTPVREVAFSRHEHGPRVTVELPQG